MIAVRCIFDLGKIYERLGIVVFDIRVDAGRYPSWRIAAPSVARTSSQRGLSGRRAAWRRPDRDNIRARARLTYRRRKDLIRHAKHPDHTDHCRFHSARQLEIGSDLCDLGALRVE